jgi:hypothetical protein
VAFLLVRRVFVFVHLHLHLHLQTCLNSDLLYPVAFLQIQSARRHSFRWSCFLPLFEISILRPSFLIPPACRLLLRATETLNIGTTFVALPPTSSTSNGISFEPFLETISPSVTDLWKRKSLGILGEWWFSTSTKGFNADGEDRIPHYLRHVGQ